MLTWAPPAVLPLGALEDGLAPKRQEEKQHAVQSVFIAFMPLPYGDRKPGSGCRSIRSPEAVCALTTLGDTGTIHLGLYNLRQETLLMTFI